MAITKEQAIDILDKFDFFQGQRAGRELWNDKPYEVQEEDIKAFSRDVAELKAYIADVVPKSEVVNILDELMKEAREIADRYEKSANETSDYDYARIEYRGCQMGALLVLFKIAELKKKYTEGEDERKYRKYS